MGFGGAVDINILAVMGLMDRLEIPLKEQDEMLVKVQTLASIILTAQAKRRKKEEK